MGSLVLNGATSGSTTLTPTDAVTATLTLPSATTTLAGLTTPSFTTTIGVGGATASASGSGVSFPATQSASSDANTLDDYEEGTFTPALNASGYTFTLPVQQGLYTKIGNCVTFKLYMTASVSSGSGTVLGTITGLPFVASARNENFGGCSFFPDSGSTFWSRVGVVRTQNNSSSLYVANGWSGTAMSANMNWATLPASTEFEISGHYYV